MMRYKVSQNRVFTIKNHSFLFLTGENAIFEIEPETSAMLNQLSGKTNLGKKDIMAQLSFPDEEPDEQKDQYFQELLTRKIFLPTLEQEFNDKRVHTDTIILPLKTLVLQVTDACSLGCLYC